MILLSGHSLTPARKLRVENMQLTLKERDSSATLTLDTDEMSGIQIGGWMQDDTAPGKGIVWRVRSIRTAYDGKTCTVQLEHMIASLKDLILFGEIKPKNITGKSTDTTCTAKQAATYILARSADWKLGTFGFSATNPYKFDGDTLFAALETVSDSLDGAVWSYSFSSYPFTVNITQADTGVDSEMRANRNMRTISRSVDKSGMYTRFYPIGKDDLHISGDYVQKNTGTYGVISKVETDQTLDTQAELKRWANERLAKHAKPTVTIEIDGLELASATGEPLDGLTLNRVCRVPLPEFGTTIQERIVALNYSDKINQPEVVKVTLSDNPQDVTKIIAENIRSGGRGGRAAAKRDKEDHAWIEDTNDHVALCAEGIIGTDAQGNPDWERLSRLVVDGN